MPTSKRELIAPRGDKRYIRRDVKGRIKGSDDVGRSAAADRAAVWAKSVAKPGEGDRGEPPSIGAPMPATRRCSIEIKDAEIGKTLLYTSVDLTKAELKAVIERNMRLAGLPDDAGLTAPDDEETEDR